MNVRPSIQSVGIPPDKHAERVVWEMLQYLHAGQRERWANAQGALRSSQMGTPIGQQRAVARFAKTVGDLALRVELSPAKPGRYILRVVSGIAYDPVSNHTVMPGEPLPPTAQLAVTVSHSTGRNHRPIWDSSLPLVVSRHAMMRLAQRANVRTVNDLLLAVRECWDAAEALLLRMLRDGLRGQSDADAPGIVDADGDAWFAAIPAAGVRLPLSGGAVAVIGHADTLGKRLLIVKTILDGGMQSTALSMNVLQSQRELEP